MDYYSNLKIAEAKKLIRQNFSFSEVSEMLYFDSLPHFTKTFKKYMGVLPSEFKK